MSPHDLCKHELSACHSTTMTRYQNFRVLAHPDNLQGVSFAKGPLAASQRGSCSATALGEQQAHGISRERSAAARGIIGLSADIAEELTIVKPPGVRRETNQKDPRRRFARRLEVYQRLISVSQ